MAATQETINAEDIKALDLDELKNTSAEFDVSADDIEFPSMAHHMTVRGKLEALVDRDVISYDEMDEVYGRWKETKK